MWVSRKRIKALEKKVQILSDEIMSLKFSPLTGETLPSGTPFRVSDVKKKRGRPVGSKNKRPVGRPKGSKNKK